MVSTANNCTGTTQNHFWKPLNIITGGISPRYLISICLSGLFIMMMIFLNYKSNTVGIANYFYWINGIPAVFFIIAHYRKVQISIYPSAIYYGILDYTLIKMIFHLMEYNDFYIIGTLISSIFIFIESLKVTRNLLKNISFIMVIVSTIILHQNINDIVMVVLMFLYLKIIPYKSYVSTEIFYNRMFVVVVVYCVDAIFNYHVLLELCYAEWDILMYPLILYILWCICVFWMSRYVEYFGSAFSLVNCLCIHAFNRRWILDKNQLNPTIQTYVEVVSIIAFIFYVFAVLNSKTKPIRYFPPKYHNLYIFSYFTLKNYLKKMSCDNIQINVDIRKLIPRSNEKKEVKIRIIDFKIIVVLHILTDLVHKYNRRVDLNEFIVRKSISKSGNTYYSAIVDSLQRYTPLDKEVEITIIEIINTNNSWLSSIFHFIGFKNIHLSSMFSIFDHSYFDRKLLAKNIEDAINNDNIGNIISMCGPIVGTDFY